MPRKLHYENTAGSLLCDCRRQGPVYLDISVRNDVYGIIPGGAGFSQIDFLLLRRGNLFHKY